MARIIDGGKAGPATENASATIVASSSSSSSETSNKIGSTGQSRDDNPRSDEAELGKTGIVEFGDLNKASDVSI